MKTEIFIVTYARDFPWLKYCLRSIDKFVTGFNAIRILVPGQDQNLLQTMVNDYAPSMPVVILAAPEWDQLGFLWHENQIMHANEWCPEADFIAHIDPDCVFTGPVTPETYIRDGKPILRYEKFSSIGVRHPGVMRWKEATEMCLPFPIEFETMRCHPEVYHRGLYAEARKQMVQRTGLPVDFYIKNCKNDFPQTFAEFVTLGNVAMRVFPEKYVLVEQTNDTVTPPNHLQQFWSHGALDQPQEIWVLGQSKNVVPARMLADLGLL